MGRNYIYKTYANMSYIYMTQILWRSDAENWLWKKPWSGKNWRQEEKRRTEDEMVRWHYWLNGHNLSKLQELVMNKEAWHAAVHGITKSWARPSDWTELFFFMLCHLLLYYLPVWGEYKTNAERLIPFKKITTVYIRRFSRFYSPRD